MADVTPSLSYLCTEVQTQFPKNCSGAVKHIAAKLNYPLPDVPANNLIDYFNANWSTVDETQAQRFADANRLVVAGKKTVGGSGHVVVVLPGGKTRSGGYSYTKKGQTLTAPFKGDFPKSCSTAAGSWPGAVSNGDKSVFDAWGSSSNYVGVTYWVAPVPAQPAR